MIRIVVTITDAAQVVYACGETEKKSGIIEIPDENIPEILKRYLLNGQYQSLNFSLLDEGKG